MKAAVTLLLLVFSLVALGQKTKKATAYRMMKTVVFDLNNDDKPDTIILSSNLNGANYFNKISISLSGFKKQIFKAKDSWTVVDKWFLESNRNGLSSKLLFVKKTNLHAVIVLFGEIDGAGYRGEFSIINVENNNSKMVFDHYGDGVDVELPTTLADLENNGRLCFVYTYLHELFASSKKGGQADIGPYVPHYVYPVDNNCRLDKQLSRQYMEQHYVYAGFDPTEKVLVLYPNNGSKPKLWHKQRYN